MVEFMETVPKSQRDEIKAEKFIKNDSKSRGDDLAMAKSMTI